MDILRRLCVLFLTDDHVLGTVRNLTLNLLSRLTESCCVVLSICVQNYDVFNKCNTARYFFLYFVTEQSHKNKGCR